MFNLNEKKRRFYGIFTGLTFFIFFLFSGCGNEEKISSKKELKDSKDEITVFAAASLTEALTEIGNLYMEENPELSISFNFDSSGTLKTQIEEGALCDIFISAAPKQMNQLDITQDEKNNPDRLDFIDPDTRINLLENKVCLCVSGEKNKDITSFEDLKAHFEAGDILFAMGNEDVPVGQYTQKILEYLGLNEEELSNKGLITYGSNVKEVTTLIKEGMADAGIVYSTDAGAAGLFVVSEAESQMCGQVIYPAAILKESKNRESADVFFEFITGDKAAGVFKEAGLSMIK